MSDFSKQKQQILDCVKQLRESDLLGVGDSVSLRIGNNIIVTRAGADLSNLTENDCEVRSLTQDVKNLHEAVYVAREDIGAIITNHAKNCVVVANCGVAIPAVLDDLVQIAGYKVKVAKTNRANDIIKTLKGRNACLVKGGGVVATGRSLEEAYTASRVLEKGAKAFIETTALGGAVCLGFFDAILQRFVYKTKYSKKNLAAEVEEAK